MIEALVYEEYGEAHNPKVAGSNPAPAIRKSRSYKRRP
jgi:hypothetical protein